MKLNFGMTCRFCGNKDDNHFYIMPLKEKAGLNDFVNSPNKYEIKCKDCGKGYLFEFRITDLELSGKINTRLDREV